MPFIEEIVDAHAVAPEINFTEKNLQRIQEVFKKLVSRSRNEAHNQIKSNMDYVNQSICNTLFNTSSNFTVTFFIVSGVGLSLSSVAVALLILTAILFKQWRDNYKNILLLQFIISRYLYVLSRYFLEITAHAGRCRPSEGIFLYFNFFTLFYTELALVTWMFVFSKQMHDSLVKVFYKRTGHFLLKTSLAAWLVPAAIVTSIILALQLIKILYIQVFIAYVFLIKWPLVFSNAILLVLVLRSVIKSNNIRNESNKRIVIVMILMIYFFCFQQVIHDVHEIVYIVSSDTMGPQDIMFSFFITFNIFILFQCPVSTMFWLFANAETRALWSFPKETQTSRISLFI